MKQKQMLFIRMIFFIFGLMFFALGIAITIVADVGISAWDACSVGLYDKFQLTIGTWMNITSILLIILGGILRKERPKMSCMITSFVMSAFVDVFVYMMEGIILTNVFLQAIVYLLGVILVSFGCGTYLIAEFSFCPIDYFMMALKEGLHTNIRNAMTLCEGSGFLLALLVSGPIGIGTLLSVFIYGPMIQFFHQHSYRVYQHLSYKFP